MFDLFDNTAESQLDALLASANDSKGAIALESWQIAYLLKEPHVEHPNTPLVLKRTDAWSLQESYSRILDISFQTQSPAWIAVMKHIGTADPLNILLQARRKEPEELYWFLNDVFVEFPNALIGDCREVLLDISAVNTGDGVDIVALEAIRTYELLSSTEYNLHIGLKIRQLEIHQNSVDAEPVQYSISGRASDEEHASRLAGARALAIAEYINELQALLWHES